MDIIAEKEKPNLIPVNNMKTNQNKKIPPTMAIQIETIETNNLRTSNTHFPSPRCNLITM